MSLYQSLYFMALAGGLAGLIAWAVLTIVTAFAPVQERLWIPDLIAASVLGGLIGGMTVFFGDRWSGNRVMGRWVLSGTMLGILAGLAAALLQIPISRGLPEAPVLARVIAWALTGSLIGFGLGLRWVSVNPMRAAHAVFGGLIGGALGGSLFSLFGSRIPDFSQALGFVLTGVGISFGITFAPILLRDGLVQFISSGDPRAQSKFGRTRKQWEVQDGDTYVIGSQGTDMTMTRFRPDVEIYIPDAAIAPRHAKLYAKEGRFYLSRHPETNSEAALRRFVLRVRNRSVTTPVELHNEDDILIGRTALVFLGKRTEGSQQNRQEGQIR